MYPNPKRIHGLMGQATPKQIEYAKQISSALCVNVPKVKSKQEYSDFICKYARRYKEIVHG